MKRFITMLIALIGVMSFCPPQVWATDFENVYFKAGSGDFLNGEATNDRVYTSTTAQAFNVIASTSTSKAYKLKHVDTGRWINSGTSGFLSTSSSSDNARYFFFYEATVTESSVTGTLVSEPVLGKKYVIVVKNEVNGYSGYYAIYAGQGKNKPNRLDVVNKLGDDLPQNISFNTETACSNGTVDLSKTYWKFTNAEIEAGPYPVGKDFTIRSVGHANNASYYLTNPGSDKTAFTRSSNYPADDEYWRVVASHENADGSWAISFKNGDYYFAFMATTSEENHSVTINKFDVDDEKYVNIQDVLKYWPAKSTDNRFLYMAVKDDNSTIGWGAPANNSTNIRSNGYSYQFCIEPAKTFEDYKNEQVEAFSHTVHGKIGYHTTEAYNTATAAIQAATDKAGIKAAIDAFNSSAIIFPEEGKNYVFKNVLPNGTETFFIGENASGLGTAAVPTTGPTKEGKYPTTAAFRAHKLADGQYEFTSVFSGKYLAYKSLVDNNSNTKVSTTKLVSTYGDAQGSFILTYDNRSSSETSAGSTIIQQSNGTFNGWGATSSGSRTDYSNLFHIEEVEALTYQPDTEKTFFIKNNSADVYLKINGNGSGNSILSSSDKSKVVFEPAVLGFAIKNAEEEKYLGGSGWSTSYTSTAFAWIIEEVETGKYTFNQQTSSYTGYLGSDAVTEGSKVYVNKNVNQNGKWLLEEYVPSASLYNITYKFPVQSGTYSVVVNDVEEGKSASDYIPTISPYFAATGVEGETVVDESHTTFTVTGTWSMPFKFSTVSEGVFAEGATWYTIQNNGNATSNTGNGHVYYMNNTAKENSIGATRELKPANLFCFVAVPNTPNHFVLYNMQAGATSPLREYVNTGFQHHNQSKLTFNSADNEFALAVRANNDGLQFYLPAETEWNAVVGRHVNNFFSVWSTTANSALTDNGSRFFVKEVDDLVAAVVAQQDNFQPSMIVGAPMSLAANLDNAITAYKSAKTNATLQALAEANEAPDETPVREFDANKYYRLIDLANRYVYAVPTADAEGTPTEAFDLRIYAAGTVATDAASLFQIHKDGDNYTIQHVNSGYYIGVPPHGEATNLAATAAVFAQEKNGLTKFLFKKGTEYLNTNTQLQRIDGWNSNGEGSQWELEEVASISVDFKQAGNGYATLYAPVAVEVPEGIVAYTAARTDNYLTATEVTEVPAKVGVILKKTMAPSSDEKVMFSLATTEPEAESVLTGTCIERVAAEGQYVFSIVNEVAGFYKFGGESLAANKAYFVPEEGQMVQGYILDFDGITTGINAAEQTQSQKVSFDLQGRRVNKAVRGLFIQNGVKVIK